MKTLTRPRLVVLVFALLALPAVTCGVAPALRDLMLRTQRLEAFAATVPLPPALVDANGTVVGPVLDYNRIFMFSSVDATNRAPGEPIQPMSTVPGQELATVMYTPPGGVPLVLEANRDQLLTLEHGHGLGVFFESSDCSGTPWVSTGFTLSTFTARTVHPRVWIAAPGRTLYAEDLEATPQTVPMEGFRLIAGFQDDSDLGTGIGTEGPCEPAHAFGLLFRPMHAVADLDALFTPPFRIVDARSLLNP